MLQEGGHSVWLQRQNWCEEICKTSDLIGERNIFSNWLLFAKK